MSQDNSIPEDRVVQIQLTQGYTAIISMEDTDLVEFKWTSMKAPHTVYAYRGITKSKGNYAHEYLHRAILERMVGRPLTRKDKTDHIDGDGLNNRRENLRLATNAQNIRNQRIHRDNTSGYKGVSWHEPTKKWLARIIVDYKDIHLGRFDTPEDAHQAYCEASAKYHGEYGRVD